MGACCNNLNSSLFLDPDISSNIYEKYGGMDTVNAFVELLFDKLTSNKYTKNRFASTKIGKVK
jgi:hypothetical protein